MDKEDNIISLVTAKPAEEETPPYQEHVVKALEELLEKAKVGEISHLVVTSEDTNNTVGSIFAGGTRDVFQFYYALGAMRDYYEDAYIRGDRYEDDE
jgi:adenylosuccinate lyase